MFKNPNKILIPVAIVIAGLMIAGALVYLNQEKVGEEVAEALSPQEAAEKAINYINQNMLQEGLIASLISVTEGNGVYKFHFKVEENEFDFYVTKDGRLLFPGGYNLEETQESEIPGEGTAGEAPKEDRPDVKLFVMSYCPYGLQAQKMFLPVYDLLKEKADMGVYFVDYIMHEKKEIDENLRQYCIQKEQEEKYYDYLSCFVIDGNYEKCLSEAGIDRTKLATCISETDGEYNITSQYNDESTWLNGRYPKFDVHSDLNQKYGVRGSPTVVINDQVVNVNPRSPEKFKDTICQTFTSPPQECSQTLSNDVPLPGFGTGTSSSSGGSCE